MASTTSEADKNLTTTFLVIGGGIAGVSCCEHLRLLCPADTITLLTESALIKTVTNLVPIAKTLTRFDVVEQPAADTWSSSATFRIITGDRLQSIDADRHSVQTAAGRQIRYSLLCICTGARPHLLPQVAEFGDLVLGIRDTESVAQFQRRVRGARRLAIVGNGGIAAECAFAVRGAQVDWVIRDRWVAQTFVDPGAAAFFGAAIGAIGGREEVEEGDGAKVDKDKERKKGPVKRLVYGETELTEGADGEGKRVRGETSSGAALGPDWHRRWDLTAGTESSGVTVHTSCEVAAITPSPASSDNSAPDPHPLQLHLNNGTILPCDLVVSATGVRPNIAFECLGAAGQFRRSPADGGLLVDRLQRTSLADVYAAGDVCSVDWPTATTSAETAETQPADDDDNESEDSHQQHWLQMRLWTQARQMGAMAARAMAARHTGQLGADPSVAEQRLAQDFCFELFGHVTQLFGFQVVLLGRFNGQGLRGQYEVLLRTTPGVEYIKYVLAGGRVVGAILVGETGLEETTENLILNALDVSGYGEGLLDPDVDIEDYFD